MTAASSSFWLTQLLSLLFLFVGAGISFWSTRSFDDRRQKKIDQGHAYSIVFKSGQITNDLMQLNNVLVKIAENKSEELKAGLEVWQLLPELFGWGGDISFSPEEKALVAGMGDGAMVSCMEEMSSGHAFYVSAAGRLNELKKEFSKLGTKEYGGGDSFVTKFTKQEEAEVMLLVLQMRTLADSLAYELPEALDNAKEFSGTIGSRLKSHYKFKHMNTIEFVGRDGLPFDFRDRE